MKNKTTFIFLPAEFHGFYFDEDDGICELGRHLEAARASIDERISWEFLRDGIQVEGIKFLVADWGHEDHEGIVKMYGEDALETFLGGLFEFGYNTEVLIEIFEDWAAGLKKILVKNAKSKKGVTPS